MAAFFGIKSKISQNVVLQNATRIVVLHCPCALLFFSHRLFVCECVVIKRNQTKKIDESYQLHTVNV